VNTTLEVALESVTRSKVTDQVVPVRRPLWVKVTV
jgi:hypothetical protein